MRFMMLVKADTKSEAGTLPDERTLSEMGKFNEEMIKAGIMLAGDGLQPSAKGARIKYSGAQRTVIDGPFTEAKELIAGFWLIRVASKAEAIEWARRAPFQDGEIEVRQVFEMEDFPVDPAEQPDGWRQKEKQFREVQQKQAGNR
jgi:hypothetical protein